jgi:hypothetical protein
MYNKNDFLFPNCSILEAVLDGKAEELFTTNQGE